ncbi:MAG: inositol monophosphatase [Planctomycetota bacterium]|nr:MAG: inositol monophosphatase [Planctomycetota bacterium]
MSSSEKDVEIRAVGEAGKVILSLFQQDQTIQTKGKAYNLVTEADIKSEEAIVSTIKESFPDHAFLAEETGKSTGESEYMWVIDPLDGTNNYAHKFPHFSISIALCKDEKPVLGVIYDPLREELFCAEQGKGSYLNDERIRVSSTSDLSDSILATGFYYDRGSLMKQTLQQMEAFFGKPIRGIRRTGSAALDMSYVACGRLDGFWELILSPWDYAAAAVIATEAGGKVTDIKGGDFDLFMNNIVVSNTQIHDGIIKVTEGSVLD